MSVPSWRRNAQLFAARTVSTSTVGTYVGADGNLASVNVGESTISVPYATRYRPWPTDPVVLTWINEVVKLTGPAHAKSKLGTVTAVANPLITILCDGRSYTLYYAVSYTDPQVGDTVAIDWDGNFVSGAVTGTPDTGTVDPKLTSDQQPFTLEFFATASGAYDTSKNAWVSPDLYCASGYDSAWFYGTRVTDSLDDDAYISSVEVFLSLKTRAGTNPTIGTHDNAGFPSGGGVSLDVTDGYVVGWQGWQRLPVAWAEVWRATPGGLGLTGGAGIFKGITNDRESGKLRIIGRQ